MILLAAVGVLAIQNKTLAQDNGVTAKTATKEKGYTVLNTRDPIVIYKYAHPTHSPKEAEKYAPKYFFTTSSSEKLYPLNKLTLKEAFPENHAFHDALDVNFKQDEELISYDQFHKMYKLTWIYKNTNK
ncbi:hypothetical protein BH10BAC2_BH10BAC2_20440 [soil metagenome]